MKISFTKKIIILIATIAVVFLFSGYSNSVSADSVGLPQTDCLQDPAAEGCQPARLRGLEGTVVNLIYVIWVMGIPLFGGIGIFIGYQYMVSGGDAEKQAQLKQRGLYWVIGIILFFASQPIAAAVMGFFVTENTQCFNDTPGFQIFFSDVCSPGGSSTPIGGGDPLLCSYWGDFCTSQCEPYQGGPLELVTAVPSGNFSDSYAITCACGGVDDRAQCQSVSTTTTPLPTGTSVPDSERNTYTVSSCSQLQVDLNAECSQICGREYSDPSQPGCRNAPSYPCEATSDSFSTTPGLGYTFNNTPDFESDVKINSITCTCDVGPPIVSQCISVEPNESYPSL